MTSTALAPLEDLDQQLVREIEPYLGGNITPAIARTALLGLYAGAPRQQVALAFALCSRYDLDPIAGHVKVYKPQGSDDWTWTFSPDGRIELAQRHPDFEGITFDPPELGEKEIRVTAYAWRKGWKHPVGPIIGRCRRRAWSKRMNREYDIEWAEEIARARAIKHVLRIAFGVGAASAGGTDHADVIDGEIVDEPSEENTQQGASADGEDGRAAPEEAPTASPAQPPTAPSSPGPGEPAAEPERTPKQQLITRLTKAAQHAFASAALFDRWIKPELARLKVARLDEVDELELEALAEKVEKIALYKSGRE